MPTRATTWDIAAALHGIAELEPATAIRDVVPVQASSSIGVRNTTCKSHAASAQRVKGRHLCDQ